jgi:CheY-like chemotaxis protein
MNQRRKHIARPGAEPRILVVEDDSDLALLIAYNLEAQGYVVESVELGDEAEFRLTENPPDLVILDWARNLPPAAGAGGYPHANGYHGDRARLGVSY